MSIFDIAIFDLFVTTLCETENKRQNSKAPVDEIIQIIGTHKAALLSILYFPFLLIAFSQSQEIYFALSLLARTRIGRIAMPINLHTYGSVCGFQN